MLPHGLRVGHLLNGKGISYANLDRLMVKLAFETTLASQRSTMDRIHLIQRWSLESSQAVWIDLLWQAMQSKTRYYAAARSCSEAWRSISRKYSVPLVRLVALGAHVGCLPQGAFRNVNWSKFADSIWQHHNSQGQHATNLRKNPPHNGDLWPRITSANADQVSDTPISKC